MRSSNPTAPVSAGTRKALAKKIGLPALFAVLGATLSVPQLANAESRVVTGGGTISADASVDFRIIIPQFLIFRVGTGTNFTTDGTIDQITFDYTANPADVGTGNPAASITGGDAGTSVVNTSVISNGGQITITENNNSGGAGMDNGAGSVIPFSEITTTSSDGNLPPPTLSDAGGNTSAPALNILNVTNRQAQWTFAYLNSGVVDPGTYGGSANGGRVTYTASTP
jgi:hypothetical protein